MDQNRFREMQEDEENKTIVKANNNKNNTSSIIMCLFYFMLLLIVIVLIIQIKKENNLNYILPEIKTNKPVIGVLTQPSEFTDDGLGVNDYSFFPASYVKWLEQAGAQIVPILFDYDQDILKLLVNNINALVMPGGQILTDGQNNTNKYMFDLFLEANKKDFFPLLGICLGHQNIHRYFSNNYNVTVRIANDHDVLHPLEVLDRKALPYKDMSDELFYKLTHYNINFYSHVYAIPITSYEENPELAKHMRPTAVNKIFNSSEYFVSSAQGINLPIISFQYHPEKVNYELILHQINHTHDAIDVSQQISKSFIDLAKRNSHKINYTIVDKYKIENFKPFHLNYTRFSEIYIFEAVKSKKNQKNNKIKNKSNN